MRPGIESHFGHGADDLGSLPETAANIPARLLPETASRLDANLDEALTFADPIGGIGNICGLPAISVPCGFGQHGLPAGIQFIGRALNDAKIVQAARIFQRQTDWHRKHPSLS